jgi:hypothetical protein
MSDRAPKTDHLILLSAETAPAAAESFAEISEGEPASGTRTGAANGLPSAAEAAAGPDAAVSLPPPEPAVAAPNLSLASEPPPLDDSRELSLEALAERVRRLEKDLQALQDTRILEERVAERMARRLGNDRRRKKRDSAEGGIDSRPGSLPMPIATEVGRGRKADPTAGSNAERSQPAAPEMERAGESEPTPSTGPAPQVSTTVSPPVSPAAGLPTAIRADPPTARVAELPVAQVAAPPVAAVVPSPAAGAAFSLLAGRPGWLVFDIYNEAMSILRMFVDPHYRLPWWARLVTIAFLAAILTSWVWLPGTSLMEKLPGGSILATIYDKVVDLILAFILFKILGHEARRYQATFPELAGHR